MNDRIPAALLQAAQAHAAGAEQTQGLLAAYQNGDSYFASSRLSLLAQGEQECLPACAVTELVRQASQSLQQAVSARRPGLVLGALPFDVTQAAHLFLPAQVQIAAGTTHDACPSAAKGHASNAGKSALAAAGKWPRAQALPGSVQYRRNVARILREIEDGSVKKVVLSRCLQLALQPDPAQLLTKLAARNPSGYHFALQLGDNCLIGASPELLLARHGREVSSHPLAGSVPRSTDVDEDQRRAAALLRSAKDLHEHRLVVDEVARALRPYCRKLQVPHQPALVATPTMWHLGTRISGELADPQTTSLQLALALHPTPAVCGFPAEPARRLLQEIEGFERGWFAGLLGWCDAFGDGEWAVTLRCAEVGTHGTRLYAGAGVVAGSDPYAEWQETSAKLQTMLQALELPPELAWQAGLDPEQAEAA